jgi:hypothetical protein
MAICNWLQKEKTQMIRQLATAAASFVARFQGGKVTEEELICLGS